MENRWIIRGENRWIIRGENRWRMCRYYKKSYAYTRGNNGPIEQVWGDNVGRYPTHSKQYVRDRVSQKRRLALNISRSRARAGKFTLAYHLVCSVSIELGQDSTDL